MQNDVIKKVLDDAGQLYSLPQTLAEVLKTVADENSVADDLAKVLIKDPALTAKILRVVNSPFYGVGRKIGSVSQAVITIGTRQVTALALSTSIYQMTDKWESCLDRVRFWRHSLEVAIASRTIAEKVGYKSLEEIFVAGLLHDIGLLILENSFPEKFQTMWRKANKNSSLSDLEEETWGTNHAKVGQFLLEQWGLPESICNSIGQHHNVFTPGTTDPEFIPGQIVNLANRLAKFSLVDNPYTQAAPDVETRLTIIENLGLERETILNIEKHLFNQTLNESKYLEMDIGSIEEILAEANRLLFDQYAAVEGLLEDKRSSNQNSAGQIVKEGFNETIKETTHSLTRYVENISMSALERANSIIEAIDQGSIKDPQGLVKASLEPILGDLDSVRSLAEEVKRLTAVGSSLDFDQQRFIQVTNRIDKELEIRDRIPIT